MASMITQCGAAHPRDFRPDCLTLAPRRKRVGAQAQKGFRGKLGVSCGHLPYQFEKQGQRARRPFMLQRTINR